MKELYLLYVKHDFLVIRNPRQDHLYIPQPQPEKEDLTTMLRQLITVYNDYSFLVGTLTCYYIHFKLWASQTSNKIHFC